VAFDLDRDDWRTFRVDRITRWVATGVRSGDRERPDAAALVAEGIAVSAFEMQAIVRVHLARSEVERIVAPNVAVVDHRGTTASVTMLRIGGPVDWVAGYLIGLPCAFDIVEPDELRTEVARQAEVILRRHRTP
jgi:predicted DNA-binding transcriptional regulator YafY